ncbi:MAG: hypothetical protein LQ338_006987 [Usnochroma carphineum]|nr:MAG: hypothetical protein LQ338_006987 [Usnochroma carphineum]
MFASTLFSRLSNSASQPLLPLSSPPSAAPPYTDITLPSSADASATLLALARQEAHLQSHIQYLLDVQSDRLLEGMGGEAQPTTPPLAPAKNNEPSSWPQKSAQREPPSLQAARTEIADAISSLASLKADSSSILSSALDSTTSSLSTITSLQRKKSALLSKISELETSPTSSSSIDGLAREEEALAREIYELENRLFEMKARQRVLRQRVREGRNREEARASSWRRSLEMVEREEREVLGRGAEVLTGAGVVWGKGKESVWDLPPTRRTLEMAGEFFTAEQEELRARLGDVGKEREALEDGGRVWEEVVGMVGDVEGLLEGEMRRLGGDGADEGERRGAVERVLTAIRGARESVEGKLRVAEKRGWKLLVVAVGAELEALVEGERVLRGVLGVVEGEERGGDVVGKDDRGKGLEGVRKLNGEEHESKTGMIDETDDDEPGPELLMSTQEEDVGHLRI